MRKDIQEKQKKQKGKGPVFEIVDLSETEKARQRREAEKSKAQQDAQFEAIGADNAAEEDMVLPEDNSEELSEDRDDVDFDLGSEDKSDISDDL